MIFSVWNADGGYEYFETPQRHGIGDDLPDPILPSPINRIGVPAQDVGRPVPAGARRVGSGVIPRGVIAPMNRQNVSGLQGLSPSISWGTTALCIIVGAVLWEMYRGKRTR